MLGPSGCGKTTLLRAVAGFVAPDAGTIVVDNHVLFGPGTEVPPERRGVALVPQEGSLFPHLDVAGNVAFGLPRDQRRGSRRVARCSSWSDWPGTPSAARRALRRAAAARRAGARLAPSPRLVLLDEPFSALDAGLRGAIRSDVRTALAATGATAVLVTHDQDEALSMADTVAVMDDGVVHCTASPEQVYTGPVDLGVARFVGQLVELRAELEGTRAHTVSVRSPRSPVRGIPHVAPAACWPCDPSSCGCTPGAGTRRSGQVESVSFHGHDATAAVVLDAPGSRLTPAGADHGPTASRATASGSRSRARTLLPGPLLMAHPPGPSQRRNAPPARCWTPRE